LVNSIAPYADFWVLKDRKLVGGTAQQRIETAVKPIGKITPQYDSIASELALVRSESIRLTPIISAQSAWAKKSVPLDS